MNNIDKVELRNIFQKITCGEKEAIEDLYRKYQSLVTNIAFSIVKDKNLSEEICQNVFLKIMQLPKDKLPLKNESSWLYSVVKNYSIEYLRKQRSDVDISTIYNLEDKDNEINKIIDRDSFNRLIECLDVKEKEIVSLKILTNLSFREIGLLLEIPTGTIQWKYYKAIHTLKIFISNLTMFVITFLLYIAAKETEIDSDNKINNNYSGDTSIDSIIPGGITADSATTGIQSNIISLDVKEIGLFSISSIFLVLTIIFGIILAKRQQKRKKKTSK